MKKKEDRTIMEKHIHTWNDYKSYKLCCSNCGLIYNEYLKRGDNDEL